MLYPDSVVGTDSHTTMIDGLGVAGWGVGGIEAEATMLGQVINSTNISKNVNKLLGGVWFAECFWKKWSLSKELESERIVTLNCLVGREWNGI